MAIESEIFDSQPLRIVTNNGFSDFKLLKITAYAKLYRASKCGKFFLIKTTKDNTERERQMLIREYELSIDCDHPNIVHTYTYESNLEVGEGIVMEYINGRTLEEYLAEPRNVAERKRLFEELLSAVGYLHKRGIIHNDLKPQNILISHTDNSLKLIDFGLADDDSHYALKTLGCTPRYASPELITRSNEIDARSDIYSIGVIMQEMLGNSSIARRCMNDSPSKRYPNIYALQRAWRNRHRPYWIISSIVLLMMLVWPTINHTIEQSEQAKEQHQRKALISQIERKVESIYLQAKDSVDQAHFLEFASRHIGWMHDECYAYIEELTESIEDPVFKSTIQNEFQKIYTKYLNKIIDIPSLLLSTPEEQWPFYDSLLSNNLPYQPYPTQ